MNDKFTINVNIAGRPCNLTIARDEEEIVRQAARMINEKVNLYRGKYANADPMDFLAVTALQLGIKVLEAEKRNDISSILERLQEANKRLEEFVKE